MDFVFENRAVPKKGSLLISDPFTNDNFFQRSVILLCEHNEDGSFGFVLNNFIDLDIHAITPDFPEVDNKLSIGGPVDTNSLYFIHTFGELIEDSQKANEHIYFGGNYEQLLSILKTNRYNGNTVRFFIGYSGWSAGQLQSELDAHTWIVVNDYDPFEIFHYEDDDLWKTILSNQGAKYKVMANFPLNPSNN